MFSLKSRKKQNKNERQTSKNCNTGVNVLGHGQILQLFFNGEVEIFEIWHATPNRVPICVKHMFFRYLFIYLFIHILLYF